MSGGWARFGCWTRSRRWSRSRGWCGTLAVGVVTAVWTSADAVEAAQAAGTRSGSRTVLVTLAWLRAWCGCGLRSGSGLRSLAVTRVPDHVVSQVTFTTVPTAVGVAALFRKDVNLDGFAAGSSRQRLRVRKARFVVAQYSIKQRSLWELLVNFLHSFQIFLISLTSLVIPKFATPPEYFF